MTKTIKSFLHDERGTTGIEYAVIGLVVSVAIVGGAVALGDGLPEHYDNLANKFPAGEMPSEDPSADAT